MKSILAIIGSPPKGETLKAVQRFEQELKKPGDVEMRSIYVGY